MGEKPAGDQRSDYPVDLVQLRLRFLRRRFAATAADVGVEFDAAVAAFTADTAEHPIEEEFVAAANVGLRRLDGRLGNVAHGDGDGDLVEPPGHQRKQGADLMPKAVFQSDG